MVNLASAVLPAVLPLLVLGEHAQYAFQTGNILHHPLSPSSLEALPPSLCQDHVDAILAALTTENASGERADPVAVLKSVDSEAAATMDEPRFLSVFGEHKLGQGEWYTEGDKLRMWARGQGFMDLTGREDQSVARIPSDEELEKKYPSTLKYQSEIRPLFDHLSYHSMYDVIEKGTSFYNRQFNTAWGQASSEYLYSEILSIIARAKPGVRLSIESIPHNFVQQSIIVRFSPQLPLTTNPSPGGGHEKPRTTYVPPPTVIIGAHQDSANYLFPALPAPGADDDWSGTVSILEAFRVLVERGYKPKDRSVEFHWYAAEEAGLLGSLDIADLLKGRNVTIDAMMEMDMTAFVKNGTEPMINVITTESNAVLNNWTYGVAKEYCDEKAKLSELFPHAGSDYMSFTKLGFPSTFATEADPMAEPAIYNPYVHTVMDRMDLANGEYSIKHMMEFSKLAIAWAVELGGWDL